VGDRLQKGG